MRDIVFKNLTSQDRKKRIIASCEVSEGQGIRSTIRRHFVCIVREVAQAQADKPLPEVFIIKERNHKEHQERFFCKIKGNVYALANQKLYSVAFVHSLRICLSAAPAHNF
jgi:hypothetical protein